MKIKDFTTGVQHIGIPTNDINKTIEFYHTLGFETVFCTVNSNGGCVKTLLFLKNHKALTFTSQGFAMSKNCCNFRP